METILNSEWSDIERTEQDEGPFEVMPIAYSIECKL